MSELQKLESELAAFQAERAAKALAKAPEEALAAARLKLANAKAIAAAEDAHGKIDVKIGVIETPEGVVIVKRPHHLTFQKFATEGKMDPEALNKLVRPCLVHPDVDGFEAVCAAVPATLNNAANKVCELAGAGAKDIAGK